MMHGHGLHHTNQISRDATNPCIMGSTTNHHTTEYILHGSSTSMANMEVLSWKMTECHDLLDQQELGPHIYLKVTVYTICDKPDTAYLHLGAACSTQLEFTSSLMRLMELAKNSSRELHKFISLLIQQENNQNMMWKQLGGRFGSSGQQCEILTSSTWPTPEGLLSNACRQGLLEIINTQTKTLTCSPRSSARGMISPTLNLGLLRTTCRPCRLSSKEEVRHHATSKAATGMVTAKRHKEDKNNKINTSLKIA
jgi:hypothetical protein